jgi:S1-C subfamily serine protease
MHDRRGGVNIAWIFVAAMVACPDRAHAERAKSPADATVYIRLVGSLHADIEEAGVKRAVDVERVEIATGSGFVISPFGYVVTNNHVVASGEQFLLTRGIQHVKITTKVSRIDVCFPQGTLAAHGMPLQCTEATVSAADAGLDLAVLFINTSNLPYVAIGDSDAVAAGHSVDALGYPFGPDVEVGRIATARNIVPEISTTPGAISALRTGDAGERRYLQITNSLNPGNSGGPLVDRDGFALGVISMKLAGSAGIGFAIPVNALKDFLESRGLDQLMPARRLRLGPVQSLEAKAIRMRMAEGMADVSAFRSHVETDARAAEIALRIDRVFSPWNLTQLEQALINSPTFERRPMSPESRKSSRLSNPPMIVGRVSDARDDGSSATQMAYGVMDLGREKLVARYVGPIEQMAFNESVLRQSLASLEGQRSPLTDTVAVDAVKWARSPAANGSGLVPMPSGWVVEPGGPSPCSGLPQPTGATSTFHADDFTVALRVAVWSTAGMAPDGAAAACSSSRGALGSASYGMQGEWLGVSYFVEGVFSGGPSGQLVQLEVIAPEQKRAFAHALLAAWLRKASSLE